MQVFNVVYYLTIVLSIMYLFSSGKDYMRYAANTAGRTHLEDKVQMAIMASLCLYGAAHHELNTWFNYLLTFPLLTHLVRIAYLSYKFTQKNKKDGN